MRTEVGTPIAASDISSGWAQAFLAVMNARGKEIIPLHLTITVPGQGDPYGPPAIRMALDRELVRLGEASTHTTANLIFPQSLWNPDRDRRELFSRYERIIRCLKSKRRSPYGTYFERLTAYGPERINQIEHIIDTWLGGNHRRSALQAMIFNPGVDHTHQHRRGFPCLQSIIFTPVSSNALAITGIYPTQTIFERAYGNYLGLWNLGAFVAQELDLHLEQMMCLTSIAMLSKHSKKDLSPMAQEIEKLLPDTAQDP